MREVLRSPNRHGCSLQGQPPLDCARGFRVGHVKLAIRRQGQLISDVSEAAIHREHPIHAHLHLTLLPHQTPLTFRCLTLDPGEAPRSPDGHNGNGGRRNGTEEGHHEFSPYLPRAGDDVDRDSSEGGADGVITIRGLEHSAFKSRPNQAVVLFVDRRTVADRTRFGLRYGTRRLDGVER